VSELPPGVITVADLYREMSGMRADVGRALERLTVVEVRNSAADTIHTDHEARIRVLERFRFTLMGAAMLAGSAAGVIATLITSGVHH
jgi:hypothetical protein